MNHDKKITRVAIYSRVSTIGKQDVGLQTEDLRRSAEQRGWQVVGEYTDEGISGATQRRPELDRLMRDTRRGLFDVVMVFRFDRMGRSVQHLIGVLEEFRSLGVEFISLHEAVDTSTSTGRLVYGVIALIAAFERELIVERVCSGLARAKRMGKVLGRPKRDDIDLARVKRLLAHGTPVAEIARMLDLPRSTIRSALKRAGEKPAPKTPPPDVVNA